MLILYKILGLRLLALTIPGRVQSVTDRRTEMAYSKIEKVKSDKN